MSCTTFNVGTSFNLHPCINHQVSNPFGFRNHFTFQNSSTHLLKTLNLSFTHHSFSSRSFQSVFKCFAQSSDSSASVAVETSNNSSKHSTCSIFLIPFEYMQNKKGLHAYKVKKIKCLIRHEYELYTNFIACAVCVCVCVFVLIPKKKRWLFWLLVEEDVNMHFAMRCNGHRPVILYFVLLAMQELPAQEMRPASQTLMFMMVQL